jgi:perosamine synthetase
MFVGEGGMICTDNDEYFRKMRFLRTHGETGKYFHKMLGYNYRMTDVEAAIGRQQLKRLDQMVAVRRRNAAVLNSSLSEIRGITLQKCTTKGRHAWHQYCILVEEELFGCNRDALSACLKEKGIETSVHYPMGLHQQPIFKKLYGAEALKVTEYLSKNILALPVHHGLDEKQIRFIVEVIKDCSYR